MTPITIELTFDELKALREMVLEWNEEVIAQSDDWITAAERRVASKINTAYRSAVLRQDDALLGTGRGSDAIRVLATHNEW